MCIACANQSDVLFNGHALLIDRENAAFILDRAHNNTLKVYVDPSLPVWAVNAASAMITDVDSIIGTNITETHSREDAQIVIDEETDTVRSFGHKKSGIDGVAWWNSDTDQYHASVITKANHDHNAYGHTLLHELLHTLGISHHHELIYGAHRTVTAMGNTGHTKYSGTLTALDKFSLQAIHGAPSLWDGPSDWQLTTTDIHTV